MAFLRFLIYALATSLQLCMGVDPVPSQLNYDVLGSSSSNPTSTTLLPTSLPGTKTTTPHVHGTSSNAIPPPEAPQGTLSIKQQLHWRTHPRKGCSSSKSANLNLSRNSLSGPVPNTLVNFSSIRFLDLSENSLSGSLPDNLFDTCFSLRFLSLSGNLLEGTLPSTLSKCSALNGLNISNNHFSGNPDFESRIWSLQRLRSLDLSNNALSGFVPKGISALHNLKELLIQRNQFSGSIPFDIGYCPHLGRIDFSENLFTGELPQSLERLNSLTFFSLSDNMFTGAFPSWIGIMSSLQYLDFSNNGFTGSLPPSMGDLKSLNYGLFDLGLEEIDFSDMGLTGSIPPGSSRLFESLKTLDLSRNNLNGNIPAEVGLLSHLRYSPIGWKFIDWPIPDEIGNCSSLYLLSLSHNNLSGVIPKSISKLSKLEILKLEFNELSGEIPQELGRLENLLAVNISYNRLTGRLPVGSVFQSLDQSALQGNLGICSPLLKGPCTLNVPKPLVLDPNAYPNQMGGGDHRHQGDSSMSRKGHHHMFLSISAIIAISAATLIAVGVIVISLLNVSARRPAFVETALESMCSSSSRSGSLASGKLILFDSRSSPDWISSPESLLNKASELGEGVFGTVYKVPWELRGEWWQSKSLSQQTYSKVVSNRFQSALGYVAPELACQSLRVNEKCDVYGFGVLILELATGRRPVEYGEDNVVILTDHVKALLEQGNVLGCIDLSMGEYPEDEVLPVLKPLPQRIERF
ncbi:hypothetical protein M0R45_020019 [Rubus argutus]|uniref:Protein kinase domain-containing protein n=1 Tax=Rubus argutus TaxID=59490 RepID=A0AAW1X800_RUBAR